MNSFTERVLRHGMLLALAWIALATAGGVTAVKTVNALSYDFGLPGEPAYAANSNIKRHFGVGGVDDPLVLTVSAAEGTFNSERNRLRFAKAAARLARVAPGTRLVTPEKSGADVLISSDGSRAIALLYPQVESGPESYARALPSLGAAAARADFDGRPFELTSTVQLAEDGGGGRSVIYEILLGALGALVVLLLVFGSLLAILPLTVAAVSILTTFLALLGLTQITEVSFVVQYLVALIGLGVAIDYSLLIVTRWREEVASGEENREAVRRAVATAGRSVMFSGITVAISLAALVAVPLPFLRSIGLGGLLIPLVSTAAALTLVPVILLKAGPALLWPRRRLPRSASRTWEKIARHVVARPWWVIGGSVAVLVAMALPALGLKLGSPSISTYTSESAPARTASSIMDAGIPLGVLRPTQVLVGSSNGQEIARRVADVDGVAASFVLEGDGWERQDAKLIDVIFADDPASAEGAQTLARVRAAVEATGGQVGGSPAEDHDFVHAVYSRAPLVLGLIIVVTFLLLARALRSLWLPIKALALNVVSIAAAYGLTVLIWQRGVGTELLFGIDATGAVTPWVPVAVFAFLFGLSMDYEVFILSRMREAYDDHGDNDRAVIDGIAHTGRLVTSAALILFMAFIALSTVPVADVKILATALALGILIDATIVRSLLAPALVTVLGGANWATPRWLAALLRLSERGGRAC